MGTSRNTGTVDAALSKVCAAARCSECLAECEVAIAKDALDQTVQIEKSLVRQVSRLCAAVLNMHDAAVPPHPYTDSVLVDPKELSRAAELAEEVRDSVTLPKKPKNRRDLRPAKSAVNSE